MERCGWCLGFQAYIDYHDTEWGVPNHSDKVHFEFLVLESAQAGLSWSTILKKRDGYRRLFADFDPVQVAQFDEATIQALKTDASIIRNEAKIRAAVNNARLFLEIQQEFGSFDTFIWSFVNHQPIDGALRSMGEARATSPESDALSKVLKKRGFKFLGSTVMYAHMQAMGLYNDHLSTCFRYREVKALQ
ncbi:DNA-3-methyladenine glycosylase I [Cytophagales bacterium LB-30]|uniref:DNA-3-methyladenine glycosylase I n=1 Tax=Shiella aurantiaca TaxID=3058365 RepID=A0ABT8F5C6_9BACT|nr:DNA-3-methyladenine glycosylase I [Shiella aurantiaca]MDN4165574.1 DNA-3-methyladenine glycosylase I [Shiella aurantiaca]